MASSMGLDRASHLRDDPVQIANLLWDAGARVLIMDGGDPLTVARSGSLSLWFDPSILAVFDGLNEPNDPGRPELAGGLRSAVFLGLDRETSEARFALELPSDVETASATRRVLATHAALEPMMPLRTLMTSAALPADQLTAATLARSLFSWHKAFRFCGWCGGPTSTVSAGWKVRCSGCEREVYPRVDPVAIMLITDGECCVLAHEPRFPDRMFSCIAGYIEPGEDIADAVRRETLEELGLTVGAVKIIDSQPWPFPYSLMIGCVAHVARGSTFKIDPVEIEEARWFTRSETRQLIAGTHPEGLWEPGPQAIAHRLIARFANAHLDGGN